jgi:hypothetical protein
MAARSAAGVQGAPAALGQVGEQPVQDQGRLQAGIAVVVGGQAIKRLRICLDCWMPHASGAYQRSA